MDFLTPHYEPWIVAASMAIATFASFVTLDLAKRVSNNGRGLARNWWIGGSLAMGTGIWSMHFVGMLAFSVPIQLGYTPLLTFLSWVAGVCASAVALGIAAMSSLGIRRLMVGSLAMGAGIFAMHYTGMAAIDMAPGIVWNPVLVAGSLAIAVGASGAALLIFFWMRKISDRRSVVAQSLAAVVMGLAISGMHYTGMAAASFPAGSVCLSADSLSGHSMDVFIGFSAIALLGITLLTSMFDARMQTNTARLAASLQSTNLLLREERESLRALTTLSSDWLWRQDKDLRFTNTSAGFDRFVNAEGSLGKLRWELDWIGVDDATWQAHQRMLARRETFRDFQLRRLDDQGRVRWVSISGMPVFDEAGGFAGYQGVGCDVTEQKAVERRQRMQHEVTRVLADVASLAEALPALIQAVCDGGGWSGGAFIRSGEITDPLDGAPSTPCFRCEVRNAGDAWGELRFEGAVDSADEAGTLAAVRSIGLQLGQFMARRHAEDEVRNERRLLADRVAERTAELNESNQRLDVARIAAEDASRAKSAFLATMSHELRTPMNGVLGMIEVLAHSRMDVDQADVVATIRTSGFSLLALIDDVLDFSKIEAGHLELERAPVALAVLADGVRGMLAAQAAVRHVDIRVEVAAGVPSIVWQDPTRLRQVLANLVGNAVKFSGGSSERRGRVSVRLGMTDTTPPRLHIAVADNGIGIAPATLATLFMPFTQGEASTTRRFGGAGLGLVIARRLVDLMGGGIEVQSTVGAGSTFSVTLPAEPAPGHVAVNGVASLASGVELLPALPAAGAALAGGVGTGAPGIAAARAENRLLLVAEDDQVNQKVLLRQLSLLGYTAEVAANGAEALRLWQEGRHALLLSDLHMPELDGYGLAQAIRRAESGLPRSQRIPILALTANALRDEAGRVLAAGMDEYLTKPIQLHALGSALARWMPHVQAAVTAPTVETAERPGAASTVDVNVLKGLVGDDMETICEFLSEFLVAARDQATEIEAACAGGDAREAGSVAHKLKASSRAVGALALGDLCAEIENVGQGGGQQGLVDGWRALASEMKRVEASIGDILREATV